jgi:hypothetical protein
MWTRQTTHPAWVIAAVVAATVPLAALLRAKGPEDMWTGFVVGVSLTLVAFAVAAWRSHRHPSRSTTAERALVKAGDERDSKVLTGAFAVVGALSLPLAGLVAIALAVGVDTLVAVNALLWTELAALVVSFAVINRRS